MGNAFRVLSAATPWVQDEPVGAESLVSPAEADSDQIYLTHVVMPPPS